MSDRKLQIFGEDWDYWPGPELAQGLRNLGGIAGLALETLSPGASLGQALDDSYATSKAVLEGRPLSAAGLLLMTGLDIFGAVPGVRGAAREARSAVGAGLKAIEGTAERGLLGKAVTAAAEEAASGTKAVDAAADVARQAEQQGQKVASQAAGQAADAAAKAAPPVFAGPPRTLEQLRDFRARPVEELEAEARSRRHLIPGPDGKIPGAPGAIRDAKAIEELTQRLADRAKTALPMAGDWFKRAQQTVLDFAGGDPTKARLHAAALALWSIRATPGVNVLKALRAHYARIAGVPLEKIGPDWQVKRYLKWLMGEDPGYMPKIHPMAENILAGENARKSVNDTWIARSFGYDVKGDDCVACRLTPEQHWFMDNQMVLVRDRLRQMLGRDDISLAEVQAALWAHEKGTSIASGGKVSLEEGIRQASRSYPEEFEPLAAHVSMSGLPDRATEHMAGIHEGPAEGREAYLMDRRGRTDEAGRDKLYQAMGVPALPDVDAKGLLGGSNEIQSMIVKRPAIPYVVMKGEHQAFDAAWKTNEIIENFRSFVLGGEKISMQKIFHKVLSRNVDTIKVKLNGRLSNHEFDMIYTVAQKYGLDAQEIAGSLILHRSAGATYGGNVLKKILKSGLSNDLSAILPRMTGDISFARVRATNISYDDFLNAVHQGSGRATQKLLSYLDESGLPEVVKKLDNSPQVRAFVLDTMLRDIEHAERNGRKVRDDLLRAWELFVDHGFQGWRDALEKGEKIPAIAFPFLLAGMGAVGASDEQENRIEP